MGTILWGCVGSVVFVLRWGVRRVALVKVLFLL